MHMERILANASGFRETCQHFMSFVHFSDWGSYMKMIIRLWFAAPSPRYPMPAHLKQPLNPTTPNDRVLAPGQLILAAFDISSNNLRFGNFKGLQLPERERESGSQTKLLLQSMSQITQLHHWPAAPAQSQISLFLQLLRTALCQIGRLQLNSTFICRYIYIQGVFLHWASPKSMENLG